MIRDVLSPEAQLLFLAAGGEENAPEMRRLLHGEIQWPRLYWMVERERASPAIWILLREVDEEAIPTETLEHIGRLRMVTEFRMVHLQQRLGATLDHLAEAGIDALLLKGAALAYTAYGSFADRPMNDIDLLVEPGRAHEARRLLRSAEWVDDRDEPAGEFYHEHHHLAPLADAAGTGLSLELHTDLFFRGHPFRLSPESLWENARTVHHGGRGLRVPSPPYQLLHACLHFAWSHVMEHSAWRTFRDVDAIHRTSELDWGGFARLAREVRATTACYWTLRLGRSLAGIGVPQAALAALRPPGSEALLNRLERLLAHELIPTESICPSLQVRRLVWQLAMRPGWSGHGDVRPWTRAHEWARPERGATPSRAAAFAVQLRNSPHWRRFIGAMLTG